MSIIQKSYVRKLPSHNRINQKILIRKLKNGSRYIGPLFAREQTAIEMLKKHKI